MGKWFDGASRTDLDSAESWECWVLVKMEKNGAKYNRRGFIISLASIPTVDDVRVYVYPLGSWLLGP